MNRRVQGIRAAQRNSAPPKHHDQTRDQRFLALAKSHRLASANGVLRGTKVVNGARIKPDNGFGIAVARRLHATDDEILGTQPLAAFVASAEERPDITLPPPKTKLAKKLLAEAKPSSSAGFDCLPVRLLQRMAAQPEHGQRTEEALAKLVHSYASGHIPTEAIAGRGIVLLKREATAAAGPDVRVIAAPTVPMRLAAKILSQACAPYFPELVPSQFGIAVGGGAPYMSVGVSAWLHYSKAHIVIATDIQDAFGSVRRDLFHRVAAEFFPILAPYIKAVYTKDGFPVFLSTGDFDEPMRRYMSRFGGAQGDGLVPILWCLVQFAILCTAGALPLKLGHWLSFFDDGYVLTDQNNLIAVCNWLGRFRDALKRADMTLNPQKSQIIAANSTAAALVLKDLAGLSDGFTSNFDVIDASTVAVRFVGVPVATAFEPLRDEVRKIIAEVEANMDQLDTPNLMKNGTREVYQTLRYCVVPRLAHLTRALPPSRVHDLFRAFDVKLERFVARLFDVPDIDAERNNGHLWGLWRSPTGLGFRTYEDFAAPAFVAQMASAYPMLEALGLDPTRVALMQEADAIYRTLYNAGATVEHDKMMTKVPETFHELPAYLASHLAARSGDKQRDDDDDDIVVAADELDLNGLGGDDNLLHVLQRMQQGERPAPAATATAPRPADRTTFPNAHARAARIIMGTATRDEDIPASPSFATPAPLHNQTKPAIPLRSKRIFRISDILATAQSTLRRGRTAPENFWKTIWKTVLPAEDRIPDTTRSVRRPGVPIRYNAVPNFKRAQAFLSKNIYGAILDDACHQGARRNDAWATQLAARAREIAHPQVRRFLQLGTGVDTHLRANDEQTMCLTPELFRAAVRSLLSTWPAYCHTERGVACSSCGDPLTDNLGLTDTSRNGADHHLRCRGKKSQYTAPAGSYKAHNLLVSALRWAFSQAGFKLMSNLDYASLGLSPTGFHYTGRHAHADVAVTYGGQIYAFDVTTTCIGRHEAAHMHVKLQTKYEQKIRETRVLNGSRTTFHPMVWSKRGMPHGSTMPTIETIIRDRLEGGRAADADSLLNRTRDRLSIAHAIGQGMSELACYNPGAL